MHSLDTFILKGISDALKASTGKSGLALFTSLCEDLHGINNAFFRCPDEDEMSVAYRKVLSVRSGLQIGKAVVFFNISEYSLSSDLFYLTLCEDGSVVLLSDRLKKRITINCANGEYVISVLG